MSEKPSDTDSVPPIRDKRVMPSGVLPKNIQNWVLGGVAVVMVVVIAFSGKNAPKPAQKPGASQATTVIDPNAARIQEYETRIDEQARKLQLEQTQLAATERAFGSSAGGRSAAPMPLTPEMSGHRQGSRDSSQDSGGEGDWVDSDKKKRAYQSLFASNLVLSYRKAAAAPENKVATPMAATPGEASGYGQFAMPPLNMDGNLAKPPETTQVPEKGVAKPPASPMSQDGADEEAARARNQERDARLARAEGTKYRLFEGTLLETVLTNRLDGYFSGPVNCMVTTNVYSHDGQRLLIPQGTRVLGEVRRVETFGQQRLAVSFHRLIMPDGYPVSLDRFKGLSQVGETGLQDLVNHHYLQTFGVSIAIGAIAGLGEINSRSGIDISAADAYKEGVESSLSQSSMRILDRYLNVLPTFTIREGHRVKIYLSDDLLLPAYENHRMPGDL